MSEEIPIYDPQVLEKHYLGERHETLKQDETLCVRPLYLSDYGRGFLELLKELTEVGNISQEQFQGSLSSIYVCHIDILIYIILCNFSSIQLDEKQSWNILLYCDSWYN